MRIKLFFLTSFFIVFSFTSCMKKGSNLNLDEVAPSLTEAAIQVLQFGKINVSVQRNAYRILSSQEKADLWKLHLINSLKSGNFNIAQNEIIKEAIVNLCKASFFENSNRDLSSASYVIFEHKAKTNFNNDERLIVFSSLQDFAATTTTTDGVSTMMEAGPGDHNCTCSMVSTYCGFWDCTMNGCNQTQDGCGTFWQYGCNGTCL